MNNDEPTHPPFTWCREKIADALGDVRFKQGRFVGSMAQLSAAVQDAVKIEHIRFLTLPMYPEVVLGHHAIRCQDSPARWRMPAAIIQARISTYLDWFNYEHTDDGVIRAAIAYLWFMRIRPFPDGNSRIAGMLADRALARVEKSPRRFYSVSKTIGLETAACKIALCYPQPLVHTSSATKATNLDITDWLLWFLGCYARTVAAAELHHRFTLQQAAFRSKYERIAFSKRQYAVVDAIFSAGKTHVTTKQWAALAPCSISAAQRDINDLIEGGALNPGPAGGLKTHYSFRF